MGRSILKNNNGVALIIAMLMMIVLTVLGIAALMTSSIETKILRNQKSSIQAFYVAEAGIEHAKAILKGSNNGFDDELLGSDGKPNTFDDGILSFGSPVSFGNGTYEVKIIDNHEGDGDPFHDTDNKVVITSTGTVDGAVKNIKVMVNKIVTPINPDGVLSIYGTEPEVEIKGNSKIDGRDHNVPEEFNCSGSSWDGTLVPGGDSVAGVYTTDPDVALDDEKILGTPSQKKGGGTYTEHYWKNLSNKLILAADTTISGEISGNQTFGTRNHPKITVTKGKTSFKGNVDGAGILIVRDEVEFSGNFHFEGLIIILGEEGNLELEDAGKVRLFGAVVAVGGEELEIELKGNAQIMYSSFALKNLGNIDSLFNVVSWQEVKS